MWCKFLLVAAVAAVVTPVSAQVTLEHIGGDTKVVRECDNLVFKFTVSGRFRRMYTVKVECFPAGAGAENADFAGGVNNNSMKVSMDVPTVMVPLPLEHDNVIEGDEMFLCFVTANRGTRISAGRIKLTILDDDMNCPAGQTSRCGMVPPPTCDNPCPLNQTEHPCPLNQTEHSYPLNQTEHPYPLNQTEGVGCFCPYGMFARANGTCVTLENCTDCPAGQTARISRTAAPNCTNPNPTEELIKTLRCFCPPGMLAREDDTCVTPENCTDCPAGQTARISRTPASNCTNPNQTEELIETLRCFCPPGMLVREDDTCVTPENCIDCPAGQTARRSKTPAPTCTNRNPPEEPTATLRCSCPDGMLIRGGACVTPDGCGSATGSGVGDPHYRTYDGVFYDLFDHCSHVFTKDCTGDTFTVISITSNACSGGGAPTCVERAFVRVPELNTEVMLNSRPLEATFVGDTPASADLSLAVTNVITVNIFKLGVVVNFGLYYLSVTVPGRYFGNTCGLVGTYDGDATNDFQLPNGTVVDGPTAEFEEAWRVDLPNDGCDPVDPQPAPPCEAAAQQQAEAFCAPLRGAAFTACHASVPPDQVFSDCVLDHCSCDTEVCGCSVIVNYAERCQALGITVGPLPAVCVPTCPMGMEYSICSPNVPPTCTNQVGQRDPCRPGCACPDGMVLRERDGQCVEPFLCEGTLVIPTNPGFRTCNARGDPHYTTFDGLAHHFQGVCYFNFACDCEEQLFHVYSKQERCFGGTVSCTTGAIIEVMGYTGRIEIGRNGAFSPDINTLPANIFQVSRVGNAYTVEILPLRVTVYYDGLWTINVKIPDAFDGRVCGLCGNSNQNPNDDFQALINGTLQQVTDLVQFGLSWANFDLADEFNCEVANAVPGPCEGSKRRRGEEFCMALRTKALDTGCIDHISPLEFINNCVFDYCAAETAPGTVDDMSGVCSHFVQYCARCAEVLGTATDLPPECLPTCPAGEDYKTCGPAQEGTCVAPEPVMQPGTCTPGCSCMEGFVRHEGNCINVTECPITASFQCNSYSVEEGDGICLPIKASGNLNRDFEVTVNLGRQLAADNTGDPTCSCRSQGDAQVCGGSDTCTVTLRAGEEYACVYVKIDGDDILEDNRTETLTLMPGDDAISIGDPSELEIRVIDDDFNALTFEHSAYYYTESRRLANNQRVQLSQAIEEPAFAELLLEGGDGDSAASAGRDFQSGVVQPYFPRGRRALFFVPIVRDRARESAECFYMTLSSPRDGESYDPVIRAWTPTRALGWIQGEIGRVPTRGRGGFACYHADNNPRDICNNDVVALVTFESEIDPKDCKLGWQATVRTVVKGAALVPQTAVNILVSAVSGCNRINFRRGEHYLVAGRLETAGGIGVFIHDVSVGQTGQVIWDSMQYAPMFQQIEEACA